MLTFLLKKLIGAAGLLLVVSFLTFFVLHLIPGDAAQIKLGIDGSAEAVEAVQKELGLDRPWLLRYTDWLVQLLQGNLGQSQIYGQSVGALIADRLPLTAALMLLTMGISVAVAIPLGVWSAVKQNGWTDRLSRTVMQLGLAVPPFWVGIVLIFLFALYIPILPPGGTVSVQEGGLAVFLKSLLLPALSLSFVEIAILLRMVRVSMLQTLQQDSMRFARSKGLTAARLYLRYGLRNALIAPVTLIGMQISGLLGGVIVIEEVFALPGLGRLLLIAVQQRDIILLEGITVFITCVVIIVNLSVDLLYKRLDPRIELV
ncbi:ABC transporter permease [Paenibacillus turpanensis]|uniref:ABC transporter permease n=1 Tax=Paenibacillus turpanensis TaxID=2689078 RepID=UPI0024432A8A|nr:ABC transporter permease [Paenibacillus turpanensis]